MKMTIWRTCVSERYVLSSMAGNNGLSYNGLTPRTETTAQTTMANGGAHQCYFFLLTPENVLVIFVIVIGTIFVNRILRPWWPDIGDQNERLGGNASIIYSVTVNWTLIPVFLMNSIITDYHLLVHLYLRTALYCFNCEKILTKYIVNRSTLT